MYVVGFPCSLSNGYLKSQKNNWEKLKRRRGGGVGEAALGKYMSMLGSGPN